MPALPPITDVGQVIQINIWLSVYKYTPNSYGHNIDQKTECEQGEDYEVGIDFHGRCLSFTCSTSGTPMQATNQPIAGMRVCGPGSLLGCREGGPGPRTAPSDTPHYDCLSIKPSAVRSQGQR